MVTSFAVGEKQLKKAANPIRGVGGCESPLYLL
jgi:hypothetical protein